MKNHIVFINNQGLTDIGGGVTILKHLLEKCSKSHQVTIISESQINKQVLPEITQLNIPQMSPSGKLQWRIRPILKAFFLRTQLRLILPKHYDQVVVLDCHYAIALAKLQCPISYISLSCIPRQQWFSENISYFDRVLSFLQYTFLERKIIQLSKQVFVSSNAQKKEISDYEFLPKFNPIILEPAFKPLYKADLKQAIQKKIIITTITRLERLKNIDAVINLAECLSDQACYFHIIGDGPDKIRLGQLIKQKGLEHKVSILGAVENISSQLAITDILFHPSHYESFGMAIFEAMYQAIPVVISDNSDSGIMGISEYIVHGKNGYCVGKNNTKESLEVINSLINNPKLRKIIGDAGAITAEKLLEKDYKTSFCHSLSDNK